MTRELAELFMHLYLRRVSRTLWFMELIKLEGPEAPAVHSFTDLAIKFSPVFPCTLAHS